MNKSQRSTLAPARRDSSPRLRALPAVRWSVAPAWRIAREGRPIEVYVYKLADAVGLDGDVRGVLPLADARRLAGELLDAGGPGVRLALGGAAVYLRSREAEQVATAIVEAIAALDGAAAR